MVHLLRSNTFDYRWPFSRKEARKSRDIKYSVYVVNASMFEMNMRSPTMTLGKILALHDIYDLTVQNDFTMCRLRLKHFIDSRLRCFDVKTFRIYNRFLQLKWHGTFILLIKI